MTEDSQPWAGTVTGDAGPYSDDQWSDMYRKMFIEDRTLQGVLRDYLNELAVSGATSPIDVASGAALVDGKFYESTATENVTIPTPATGNSRIDVIVLRKDWTAQTVRITRIAGTPAATPSAPAITQTDGTTWDIKLAEVLINDAGNITVTDFRSFVFSVLSEVHADKPIRWITDEPFSYRVGEAAQTGDGASSFDIPSNMDGWALVAFFARHDTAGSGGSATSISMRNITGAVEMFSTDPTIDVGEVTTETASTPAVIKSNGDEVVSAWDEIEVNVDVLPTTAPIGLRWVAGLQEP